VVSGFWPNTEVAWRAASDAWVTWFMSNAPATKIFKYMTDEPDSVQYGEIVEKANWIHNNPGVGRNLGIFCTTGKIDPRLYGVVDFWALTGWCGGYGQMASLLVM